MADALTYNRNQGFSKAEVAFIQRLVGSEPDGLWGTNTIAAIETWQTAHGIEADGKIWRDTRGNTWPVLLSEGAGGWVGVSPGIARIGLWTFRDGVIPSEAECGRDIELAARAGLTDIVFTIDTDTDNRFSLPSSVADIVAVGKRYKEQGIDVSLNSFIYPSSSYVDAMVEAVVAIDEQLGIRRLGIDAEELWLAHENDTARHGAANLFGERLQGVDFDVAVNGIVYTSHAELDPLVSQECVTHVTPQAYSVAGKVNKEGEPSRAYNPISLQATAAAKWHGWWPDRTIIGGFAVYDQAGTYELGTLSEDVAIGLALRTWAELGVTEVCGWSIKQLSDLAASVLRRRQ